jgi:HK97 family phage prohead protease
MRTTTRPFQFDVKAISEAGTFSGYGSVFDVVDAYRDVVQPGAFSDSLAEWKAKGKLPKMLWQHRSAEPIGVWTKMEEDRHGLYVEGRILLDAGDTERRAYEHLRAGSVDGLSIGYDIPEGGGTWDTASGTYQLKRINLWEVSIVTFPANEDAQIDAVKAARAQAALAEGPRGFERLLREALPCLSRKQVKGLMAHGYRGVASNNAAEVDEDRVVEMLSELTRKLRSS